MSIHLTHLRRCAPFLLFLLCCCSVYAQRFEYMATTTATADDGHYGITRLMNNAGYLAVGSIVGEQPESECPTTNSDVLVTRFNLNGNSPAGWPKTYDISGDCGIDVGKCILECRFLAATSGNFIVLGWTPVEEGCVSSTATNTFLMSLTPGGAVNWVRIYPDCKGERVVEAKYGDGMTTSAGDLIFCGQTSLKRPFIARVRGSGANVGNLVWNQTYSVVAGDTGTFYDVIEANNTGAGDVAAAGVLNGLASIVRVNGNTGQIVAAPHGLGQYGVATSLVVLRSLQELQVGTNPGDLVACGDDANNDIYAIQTTSNPCVKVIDATYTAGFEEEAWAIKEIIAPATSQLTAGNVVITGYTKTAAAANSDVFLMELVSGTLALAPFPAVRFHIYDGAGAGGADYAFSVVPNYRQQAVGAPTDGFVFCGVSDQSGAGDANEMYIVKTNRFGREEAACDDDTIAPTTTTPNLAVNCPAVTYTQPLTKCNSSSGYLTTLWVRNCYILPKPGMPGEEPSVGEALTLTTIPNPVRRGSDFTLTIGTGKESPAAVTVVDMSGTIVASVDETLRAGESLLTVNTKGWATGAYIVTVTAGDRTATSRIIVE